MEAAGVRIVEVDATDTASSERGMAEAHSQPGGLDISFNNAGIGSSGIHELMSHEDVARFST